MIGRREFMMGAACVAVAPAVPLAPKQASATPPCEDPDCSLCTMDYRWAKRCRKPWPDEVPQTMPLRLAELSDTYSLRASIEDGWPACSVERGWCVKGNPSYAGGRLNMVQLPEWMQEELWRQDRSGSKS